MQLSETDDFCQSGFFLQRHMMCKAVFFVLDSRLRGNDEGLDPRQRPQRYVVRRRDQ